MTAPPYDALLVDLDGTVYRGPHAIDGAVEALEGVRAAGRVLSYVTNNASRGPQEVADQLAGLGLTVVADDVITSAQAAAAMLAAAWPAGTRVLVVEQREGPVLESSRAGGLHTRTIEVLDQRGIADRFLEQGTPMKMSSSAGVTLDHGDFPTRHPYGLALWQRRIEQLLADWVDELDVPVLREALRGPAGFVGALGSRRTHRDRLARLEAAGVGPGQLARLSSPVGLDLGGRTPEETALSIVAEVVAQDLQGHLAAQVLVACTEHTSHAARAQKPEQPVPALY